MTRVRFFRITQRDGVLVTGAVRGAGGMVAGRDAHDRVCRASVRATCRQPMRDVFEPEPGFAELYPEYSAAGDGAPVRVDLRHARVEVLR